MLNLLIVRIYYRRFDWAGLGYDHRMVAWEWRGIPCSIIL